MSAARNEGKHTPYIVAARRILHGIGPRSPKSALGYMAYPDYHFRSPQGATLSVAKVVSRMKEDGLRVGDYYAVIRLKPSKKGIFAAGPIGAGAPA